MESDKAVTDKYNMDKSEVYVLASVKKLDADLKFILLFSALTTVFVYVPYLNMTAFRFILGVIFAMFVPGYSFIALLFPRKSDISNNERVLLSFVSSIAIVPFFGLLLNYTHWGVRMGPLTFCIILFIVACSLTASWRRLNVLKEERFSVDFNDMYRKVKNAVISSGNSYTGLTLTLITGLFVILSASLFAYMAMGLNGGEKYTEFYISNQDGMFNDYPVSFASGEAKPILVSIVNHEHRTVTYDLVITLNNGSRPDTLHSERVTLEHGQTWEKDIELRPDRSGLHMKMEFLLYADGNNTSPYRECYLWVDVV